MITSPGLALSITQSDASRKLGVKRPCSICAAIVSEVIPVIGASLAAYISSNTTSSAILIASFCSAESNKVTGYGSGIPEDIFQSKLNIVTSALNQSKLLSDPLEILAKYGGFEIAALVGFIIRAATLKVPIILDGVITLAAAVAADKIRPGISKNLIAGHCSAEPASAIAIKHLGLEPILDLDLRLGEGTGAVLAIPIIRAACNMTKNMGELKDYL